MAQQLPKTLNLLQANEQPGSTWDKIYQWVFSVGRYLIIAVELIVLLAFVSRFTLDRKNNDLLDAIETKVRMLQAQAEYESTLRSTQVTLNNLSDIVDNQETISGIVVDLFAEIPSAVSVSTFSISQTGISLSCKAPSYQAVQEFEENLRDNSQYGDVKVSLEKSGSEVSAVEFTVNITVEAED